MAAATEANVSLWKAGRKLKVYGGMAASKRRCYRCSGFRAGRAAGCRAAGK